MKIGFIGCGNMGGALAEAISRCDEVSLFLADRDNSRAEELANRLGASVTNSKKICQECDYVFLAVKPQGLVPLAEEIDGEIRANSPVIVSMLAGVSTERIYKLFGQSVEVIRIMPNTPVKYGKGLVFVSGGEGARADSLETVCYLLGNVGECELIEERLIDAASAVGGSGPAFFYRFIDAVARGGEECGIPYPDALRYASLTAIGASEMLLRSSKDAMTLTDEVCSPGGSTIEGVSILDREGIYDIVVRAIDATYKKAQALGK